MPRNRTWSRNLFFRNQPKPSRSCLANEGWVRFSVGFLDFIDTFRQRWIYVGGSSLLLLGSGTGFVLLLSLLRESKHAEVNEEKDEDRRKVAENHLKLMERAYKCSIVERWSVNWYHSEPPRSSISMWMPRVKVRWTIEDSSINHVCTKISIQTRKGSSVDLILWFDSICREGQYLDHFADITHRWSLNRRIVCVHVR